MTGLHSNLIRFFRLSATLLFVFAMVGCGSPSKEKEESLESLETRYKELLASSASGQDQESVLTAMRDLASAYEARGMESEDQNQAAEDLYRAAELYENSREINKVLSLFDHIIETYPTHSRAADALFKKGFVFHNIVGDTAQARVAYNEFLAKYPNDSLAKDAEMELKYLGMDPGELLEMILKENAGE